MAVLSLASPTSFRLLAASAATVGSLALVTLGVQIGTDGLGGDAGRNRGTPAATRSAAVVDLSRARAAGALDDSLLSLVIVAPIQTAVGGPRPAPSGPLAPSPGPSPVPRPAPGTPVEPAPLPPPEVPAAPALPAPPDPAPLLEPIQPIIDAVIDPLATRAAPETSTPTPSEEVSLETLTGLLGL